MNNHFRPRLVEAGLVISGTFHEGRLVEVIELPDHPWFVASQFHPEFKSRPNRPAPLFRDFVGAAARARTSRRTAAATAGDAAGALRRSRPKRPKYHPERGCSIRRPRALHRAGGIPSPSGAERAVAERVVDEELRDLGLDPRVDDAGDRVDSDAGNLYTRLEPTNGERFRSSSARISTRSSQRPARAGGRGRRRAKRGWDDPRRRQQGRGRVDDRRRASGARREDRPHAGVELVFTTREETGCQGAAAFDATRSLHVSGSSTTTQAPIGDIVVSAPYQRVLDVVYRGRAAHAGINPEDGRSAIQAAARAIADLRLGRLDEETTANVGRIDGGTARNVVPETCAVIAEARSRDEKKLLGLVQEMVDAFAFAAAVTDCEVETRIAEHLPGYRLQDGNRRSLALAALERAGFRPREVEVGGGADANVFNARGLPCVVLSNGMADIHSPDEHIAVGDLDAMVDVTLALVDAAGGE